MRVMEFRSAESRRWLLLSISLLSLTACSFDESQFESNCPDAIDATVPPECRDARGADSGADAVDADRPVVDTEADGGDAVDSSVVAGDSDVTSMDAADGPCGGCGEGVCIDGTCETCRNGAVEKTETSCGYRDRGTIERTCRNHGWRGECTGVWYRNCEEYLAANPDAADGRYRLDPDGPDGEVEPKKYYCEMKNDDPKWEGGWTLVAADTFDDERHGWEPQEIPRTECGHFGTILGGYDVLAGGTLAKTFELPPIPGETVRIYLEFIKIDSWDDPDRAAVSVDEKEIWRANPTIAGGTQVCGAGFAYWHERKFPISSDFARPDGTPSSFRVVAAGAVDEGADNESWGIDNVLIYVQ